MQSKREKKERLNRIKKVVERVKKKLTENNEDPTLQDDFNELASENFNELFEELANQGFYPAMIRDNSIPIRGAPSGICEGNLNHPEMKEGNSDGV